MIHNVRLSLFDVLLYLDQRIAEKTVDRASEVLSGNVVKEAEAVGALVELRVLMIWAREIGRVSQGEPGTIAQGGDDGATQG